jgi:hypothetical protein
LTLRSGAFRPSFERSYITKKIKLNPANIAATSSTTSTGIFIGDPFLKLPLLIGGDPTGFVQP